MNTCKVASYQRSDGRREHPSLEWQEKLPVETGFWGEEGGESGMLDMNKRMVKIHIMQHPKKKITENL